MSETPSTRLSTRRYFFACLILLALMVLGLLFMGRPWLARSGTLKLWQSNVFSSEVSQHLTDWYTFTHLVHGFVFYLALSWLFPDLPVGHRFLLAVIFEAGWEIVENTEYVIEYYRNNTMAVAYYGDTILNSLCDVLAMIVGFWTAYEVPTWCTILLLVLSELLVLYAIRDSLFLNLIMLIYPLEVIKNWQLAAV